MKRIGNIFDQIATMENLELADKRASRGKSRSAEVIAHRRLADSNLLRLQEMLIAERFQPSEYRVFKIKDPKERLIHSLPYYPDRIVHHAVMNLLEPHFMKWFTNDTYSSIKGRGVHLAARRLKNALKDVPGTEYCLKLDITKFYESIDNSILVGKLRRKIKDAKVMNLLIAIIGNATGLPIGNYTSQFLANFYLTDFDHWIKEKMRIKYYFRYADDIVILSHSKVRLQWKLHQIKAYLSDLGLTVKQNYQVFPVEKRGIDFLGYVFRHKYTLIRKSIKERYRKMLRENPSLPSIAAYNGWLKHCDSHNLKSKLLK